MANARQFMAARTAAWAKSGGWVNPYVTDGLVAMWDGEWNAGGGVHDPNATVWKDLSGKGKDADFIDQQQYVKWNQNCLSVNTYSENSSILMREVLTSDVKNFEICCSIQDFNLYSRFFVSGSDSGGRNLQFINNSGGGGISGVLAVQINSNNQQLNSELYLPQKGVPFSAGFGFNSVSDFVFFVNSSISSSTLYNTWNTLPVWNNEDIVLSQRGDMSRASDVLYHCIRFYDHKLTDAERIANYAVDKARFGLP